MYAAKLDALAATINAVLPDVLGVQEVVQPEALGDLVERLDGHWQVALSQFDDSRHIRVGFLSRHPLQVVDDIVDFPQHLLPVQKGDKADAVTSRMGRGALVADVDIDGIPITVVTCHLKSKLLSYPGSGGKSRFSPRDEAERARLGSYALHLRAAEAATIRVAVNGLLEAEQDRNLVLVGDLNDEPQAATTQILYGPGGSQIGTGGFKLADKGDRWRMWNLAPLMPDKQNYSRIYQGHKELIDHVLVGHSLVRKVTQVHAVIDRPLPSQGDDPGPRRNATDSDHAPVLAQFDL